MAQSFHAITTSLNEAERQIQGKKWTAADYQRHAQNYHIDAEKSYLNVVHLSANGKTEAETVNAFFEERMLALNTTKQKQVNHWNQTHVGQLNIKNGKPYKKRSLDKRTLFPVGEFLGKGTRNLPYNTFKTLIEQGNARAKGPNARYRTGVLQQFVIGFGNQTEWTNETVHKYFLDRLNATDPEIAKEARDRFEATYIDPWIEQFQHDNPSMHLVQAVSHYDETHPHLQITVLPWVDGKESGGLGSTSYTGAIQHDHPEMTDKSHTISQWYQAQHEKLIKLILDQNPGLYYNGDSLRPALMGLGPRPGSHKGTRVDQFARRQHDLDQQTNFIETKLHALEQRETTISTQENSLKQDFVTGISQLSPQAVVPVEKLAKNEDPQPIKTTKGAQQFHRQPLAWLKALFQQLLIQSLNKLKQLQTSLTHREQSVTTREKELAKQDQQLSRREQGVHQVEKDVAEIAETAGQITNAPYLKIAAELVRNQTYHHKSWPQGFSRYNQPHQPITLSQIFSYALSRTTESQQMTLQTHYDQTYNQPSEEQNSSRPDQGPEL